MSKEVNIKITAKFGSRFQERFAKDSLFEMLKHWRMFLHSSHDKNVITVEINDHEIRHLDWFKWEFNGEKRTK